MGGCWETVVMCCKLQQRYVDMHWDVWCLLITHYCSFLHYDRIESDMLHSGRNTLQHMLANGISDHNHSHIPVIMIQLVSVVVGLSLRLFFHDLLDTERSAWKKNVRIANAHTVICLNTLFLTNSSSSNFDESLWIGHDVQVLFSLFHFLYI